MPAPQSCLTRFRAANLIRLPTPTNGTPWRGTRASLPILKASPSPISDLDPWHRRLLARRRDEAAGWRGRLEQLVLALREIDRSFDRPRDRGLPNTHIYLCNSRLHDATTPVTPPRASRHASHHTTPHILRRAPRHARGTTALQAASLTTSAFIYIACVLTFIGPSPSSAPVIRLCHHPGIIRSFHRLLRLRSCRIHACIHRVSPLTHLMHWTISMISSHPRLIIDFPGPPLRLTTLS